MLGKAVKVRHCPATVSAPASAAVVLAMAGSQFGYLRIIRGPIRHWRQARWARLWEGAGKGASQETGPRRH
jgi:hypothetical protein